ncbi:MAG: RluA family pseudouridine synthase [Ruminococcaceae bacterium]|nr:RluA family pseudouridine synthase [Oscillospiraceae bacterium]
MEYLNHVITKAQSNMSVKQIIKKEFSVSEGHLRRIKLLPNGILLDGEKVFVNQLVKEGQLLQCLVSDTKESRILPCDISLDVLFEDEHLLVINKSAPLPTHPSSFSPDEPSVAGAFAARYPQSVFHPVNRLDTGTTGAMVIAKNGHVHQLLSARLHSDSFKRDYIAVVVGTPVQPCGRLDFKIGRCNDSVIKRTVCDDGKDAVTYYETLKSYGGFSLVKLLPLTGRTHQLRVHMAHIGCPLAGDFLYGTEDKELIKRAALHSHSLWMIHPVTKEEVFVTAPLPEDMKRIISL